MSLLSVFEENEKYLTYSGERINILKDNLYLPVILNKKFINIIGNPYSSKFSRVAMVRTTGVMWKVLQRLESNKVFWRVPRRPELLT